MAQPPIIPTLTLPLHSDIDPEVRQELNKLTQPKDLAVEWTFFSVDERLCDVTFIAKDGLVKAESSFLCRESEVFWRLFTSGMIESKTKEVKVEQWTVNIVEKAYKMITPENQPLAERIALIPDNDFDFGELLSFVHTYAMQSALYFLKLVIVGKIQQSPGNFIPARTCQLYFDLDAKFNLGLEEHLLRAVLVNYRKGKFDNGITSMDIFLKLSKMLFPKDTTLFPEKFKRSTELHSIQFCFVREFRNSGLDGKDLAWAVHFGSTTQTIGAALVETIKDLELRALTISLMFSPKDDHPDIVNFHRQLKVERYSAVIKRRRELEEMEESKKKNKEETSSENK